MLLTMDQISKTVGSVSDEFNIKKASVFVYRPPKLIPN